MTGIALNNNYDMVAHMKTTIDIADALLLDAKRAAAERGETLRELVEEGLRMTLSRLREAPAATYQFEPLLTKGGGMTSEAQGKTMHQIIYDSYGDRL